MSFEIRLVLSALMSYLLGNIQIAIFLSKIFHKKDIRELGSGNAGSTNMLRSFGALAGFGTLALDMLKGIGAFFLARWLFGGSDPLCVKYCGYIAALFVVLGHDFPAFFKFHGGKGVATTLGLAWVLQPNIVGILTTVIGVSMVAITRYVSVGSLSGVIVLASMSTIMYATAAWGDIYLVILTYILLLLMFILHIPNLKRLFKGEERKISFKKKKS